MFDYMKGDYEKIQQLVNVNWKSYFPECAGILMLWWKFHQKFKVAKKKYILLKKVRSGNIKQSKTKLTREMPVLPSVWG